MHKLNSRWEGPFIVSKVTRLGSYRITDAIRPGAAGLLIGIECSRVRDSSRMDLTSLVTT